jgi:preprotein translocase subunit SecF
MVKLRSAVYNADKNNGDVNTTLNDLRKYVYGHMNTNLSSGGNAIKPPIQLKYTYERLQSSEQKRVDSANTNVYTQAQVYCQQQNSVDFSGRNRVPCVQDYVTNHGEKANTVPAALYQYDFVSPTWSPDLAGWSLVLSVLLFVLFISSFIMDRLVGSKIRNNIG